MKRFSVLTGALSCLFLIAGCGSDLGEEQAEAETLQSGDEVCALNSDTGEVDCFASDAEAAEFIESDSRLEEHTRSVPCPSGTQCLPRNPGTGFVVARLYEHDNYGGRRLDVYQSSGDAPKCSVFTNSEALVMESYNIGAESGDHWWNDRISSFQAASGCKVKLYQHAFWGEPSIGPFTHMFNLSYMNDEASAIQVFD